MVAQVLPQALAAGSVSARTRQGIIEDIQAEWAEEVLVDPPLARCIHNTVNGKAHRVLHAWGSVHLFVPWMEGEFNDASIFLLARKHNSHVC